MNTAEILKILQRDIHSTVFATIGTDGRPQTRAIDIMLCDRDSLYFLTAKGKEFYRQLQEQGFVALSGVKGGVCVSVRGKICSIGHHLLGEIFKENPYMDELYPGETRRALEVFQLYEGQGEYFDLNQRPVFRQGFALGGADRARTGYYVTETCIGCKLCFSVCPQKCIDVSCRPSVIHQENCLHCGQCSEICPQRAIVRL